MSSRTIIVHASVIVEGLAWDIDIPANIEANTVRQMEENTKKAIGVLFACGIRPSIWQPRNGLDVPTKYATEPMPEKDAVDQPAAPTCKRCKGNMKLSTIQDEEKLVKYFCPRKMTTGYCKNRASVNIETGELKEWEVKK